MEIGSRVKLVSDKEIIEAEKVLTARLNRPYGINIVAGDIGTVLRHALGTEYLFEVKFSGGTILCNDAMVSAHCQPVAAVEATPPTEVVNTQCPACKGTQVVRSPAG